MISALIMALILPAFDLPRSQNPSFLSQTLTINNDIKLEFGTTPKYWWVYNSSSTQYDLFTTNSDGAGLDASVLTIDDGSNIFLINGTPTTAAANTYSFVGRGGLKSTADGSFALMATNGSTAGNLTVSYINQATGVALFDVIGVEFGSAMRVCYGPNAAAGTNDVCMKRFGVGLMTFDNGSSTAVGMKVGVFNDVTGADSLGLADCGRVTSVTAGIDTFTITLPDTLTVGAGCEYTISYNGANGGALVDISPLDSTADGIYGSCTVAAAVVSFSGTDDADIGLTKATGLKGDWIKLVSDGLNGWYVIGCEGIWANN